jgi:signal transduction histidine kinase
MQDLAKSNQVNIVKGYKKKIDEWLSVKKRIITSYSQILSNMDPLKDKKEIKKILQNAIILGEFRSVYIGYENNFFVTGIDWIAPDNYFPTQRPWYQTGKMKNETSITLPYVDSDLLQDVLSIVSPVYNDNTLIGILSSDLILDSIQKEILSINLPFNGFAFLISKNGHILVSPHGYIASKCDGCKPAISAILSNHKQVGVTTYNFNDRKYLVFYEPLENSDWIFATVLNEDSIFGEINGQLFKNVIMALGFNVFGIGVIFLFLFLSRKISEHKKLLDMFANGDTHAVAIVDKNKNVLFFNEKLKRILNIDKKFQVKAPISILKSEGKNNKLITSVLEALNKINKEPTNPKILKVVNEEKAECYLIQVIPIVANEDELEGFILTINDISNEYKLEISSKEHEQIMIQNSKMAAMGEMVGAITHQWRQPLAALLVMMGNMKYQVADKIISEEKLIKNFEKASEIVRFLEDTLQSFKEFYKVGQDEECFDIADTIRDVVNIMEPMARVNNIDINFLYDRNDDFKFFAYSNYLKQVIVNLISNSKDAILEKSYKEDFQGKIIITLQKSNQYIISIEDNGVGINETFTEKLFQPLQTTKGNKGTGNGLYICKLLIDTKINGELKVLSLKNPTVFQIRLPIKGVCNE